MQNLVVYLPDSTGIVRFMAPTMGTDMSVKFVANGKYDNQEIAQAVYRAVDRVDCEMSTYKCDSDLCIFNRAGVHEWVPVSSRVVDVVKEALRMGALSAGAFDITVYDIVRDWGFGPLDASGSCSDVNAADEGTLRASYKDISVQDSPPALRKNKSLRIDLCGIAKGFGVDEAARILEAFGIENYLIEIAGEIRALGVKPDNRGWTVGLELPVPGRRIVHDQIHLTDCALATSGSYRHFRQEGQKTYSHTIDPQAAAPLCNDTLSACVIAKTCMQADALATILMVMPGDDAIRFCEAHTIAARIMRAAPEGFTEYRSSAFGDAHPPL